MAKRKYIKRDDSKDRIFNYTFSRTSQTVFPDFNLKTVMDMINNDPVARGAFNAFVDKCMEGGYSILKRKSMELDREEKFRMEEKFMFNTKVLRKLFIMLKLYNNAYAEIIRDSANLVTDINILDTENIEPITEPNGDPIYYKTRSVPEGATEIPSWDKKDVVWYKLNDFSRGFAPIDLKALYQTLLTKEYVVRFMSWLWKTGQYRITYNFQSGVSGKDINDFLAMARKLDFDFTKPSIYKGESTQTLIRDMKENESAKAMLEWLDNQILVSMRIPGIDAGFMNTGSRSDTDGAKSTLSTHVKSIKSVIADYTNYDLFTKISKGNSLIMFNPSDRLEYAKAIDTLVLLTTANLSDDAKKEYLLQEGIAFSGSDWFKEPEEQAMRSATGQSMTPGSRNGKVEGASNEKVGTGEESTTREEQLEGGDL